MLRAGERQDPLELAREVAGVAGLERREARETLRVRLLEPRCDLGETRVAGDERRRSRRSGFRRDHPERLGEDRRHHRHVGEREQMHEVAMLQRAGEERTPRCERLQLRAVRPEADDDQPRVDAGHRRE